jgi:hypothetical protein
MDRKYTLPQKRLFDSYHESLKILFSEECIGAEYFRHLSHIMPERYSRVLKSLMKIEMRMIELLYPLLPPDMTFALTDLHRSGRDEAELDNTLTWDELSLKLKESEDIYVSEYEDLYNISPSHHRHILRLFKDHGNIMRDFFTDSYKTCDGTLLEKFLRDLETTVVISSCSFPTKHMPHPPTWRYGLATGYSARPPRPTSPDLDPGLRGT